VKNVVTRNLRLKERLQKATQHSGLSLDTELQDDLLQLIDKYEDNIQELEQSDFRRIFWEQQISAIKATGKQGIRWHPFFIRWCLNIMQCSPKAYNAMRESNLIILPSQRTLKDYTHWFRPQVGYQVETFTQLYEDFKVSTLTEAQQNVVLVFDEMKIHEGLVFDNQTELIIGFVDTGDLNKKFKSFEAHLSLIYQSVADLFKVFRECEEPVNVYADTTETERFCRFFNRFFDCLNTRNLYEGKQKRNDDLLPYTSSDDIRLKWLENDFLSYLEEWSNYAQSRIDVPAESRKKMMLSAQTLEGLKMTVYSFIEVVPYLLSLDGAEFILSERFNQDTVESYFAQQRARCGRGDNPAVQQVLYNSQSIRTSRTLASEKSSNIQKRKLFHDVQNLSEPLRKKRRTSSHN
jgi:hypothetical protein